MKINNLVPVIILLVILCIIPNWLTWSQPKPAKQQTLTFLKTTIYPMNGIYVVLKDANVRIQPATKGRRVGRRERGERVRVVGRAKGHWLAIRDHDGKDVGFIYRSILMPVIDGALAKPISGKLTLPNNSDCDYRIRFDGKSPAEGQLFEFADYLVNWKCQLKSGPLTFTTPMFLTEGPYRGTAKRIHQITIDIWGLADTMESVFSTHALWDRDNAQVKFDSISLKRFSRLPNITKIGAGTKTEALHGTVKIAASAWNGPLWKAIIHRQKNTEK